MGFVGGAEIAPAFEGDQPARQGNPSACPRAVPLSFGRRPLAGRRPLGVGDLRGPVRPFRPPPLNGRKAARRIAATSAGRHPTMGVLSFSFVEHPSVYWLVPSACSSRVCASISAISRSSFCSVMIASALAGSGSPRASRLTIQRLAANDLGGNRGIESDFASCEVDRCFRTKCRKAGNSYRSLG